MKFEKPSQPHALRPAPFEVNSCHDVNDKETWRHGDGKTSGEDARMLQPLVSIFPGPLVFSERYEI